MKLRYLIWLMLIGVGLSLHRADLAMPFPPQLAQARLPDAPYLPTPEPVVKEMLRLAQVTQADVVYDLSSGDGRIPITAARLYGARGVGIELNPQLVERAREKARQAGVSEQVQFYVQDIFEADLRPATVVTLYLFSDVNLRLRPKLLQELKSGTRIVSHEFHLGDWQPQKVVRVGDSTIYYWVVPARKGQS